MDNVNSISNKLTILISSPDSYRDVFDIFADLFNKNWPDCPFSKKYATNVLNANNYKGFQVLVFPDALDWISRTKSALQNIDSKYVMIIADDLFAIRKIVTTKIIGLIEYMDESEVSYCRIYRSTAINRKKNKLKDDIFQIRYNHPYGRNLLAAIWNKSQFEKFLNEAVENPWQIEERWLKEALTYKSDAIDNYIYFHNDYFFHAVYKGQWMRNARKVVSEQKIPFYSKRRKISFRKAFGLKLKSFLGDKTSPKVRSFIKKILSPFVHFDTKY